MICQQVKEFSIGSFLLMFYRLYRVIPLERRALCETRLIGLVKVVFRGRSARA